MQTIRIFRKSGGLVASFKGIAGKTETSEMRNLYPESAFYWLR